MTTKKRWWGSATIGSGLTLLAAAYNLPALWIIAVALLGALLPWVTGLLWLRWFASQSSPVRRDVLSLIELEITDKRRKKS
jgi:hypothetical protein